ncbi:unnamed protein product [Amaranthus hypochondriacus]
MIPQSPEKAMAASENWNTSDSTSYNQCAATTQESIIGEDVYNQPTSFYNYHYPGYNGSVGQSDDRDHSSMGALTNHCSIGYNMPGYYPYTSETYAAEDGHSVRQPYLAPVTYGAEAHPCYARDYNSSGSHTASENATSNPFPATKRSNGIKPSQLYGPMKKHSSVPSSSKSHPPVATPKFFQPRFDIQHSKPMSKSGSFYPSPGYANDYHPAGNNQSSSFQKRGIFGNTGPLGYKSNGKTWNENDKFSNRKSECGMSSELACGPRCNIKSNLDSSEKERFGSAVQTDKYNLADFLTEYEAAKFYVIKSYSEVNVYNCIKYNVWSSTEYGNKKLDAAFRDAEIKANETGVKCPIFLFFSVNGSGQFVGVAEMIGKVDFNKTMKFWQLDKWSGFFPLKWHIVKDVPNSQLRHILLENNENKPVTFTRDTQEIGLKHGLEMLKIFKNHLSKTSLLIDMEFYENQEKELLMKKSGNPGFNNKKKVFTNEILPKRLMLDARRDDELNKAQVESLVNFTNDLSLNSDS